MESSMCLKKINVCYENVIQVVTKQRSIPRVNIPNKYSIINILKEIGILRVSITYFASSVVLGYNNNN